MSLLPWLYDKEQKCIYAAGGDEPEIICQILDTQLAETVVYAVNNLARQYTDKASAWDSVTFLKAEITMLKGRVAQAEADRDAYKEQMIRAQIIIHTIKTSLIEMVGAYWGDGDGIYPPPECIRRAQGIIEIVTSGDTR